MLSRKIIVNTKKGIICDEINRLKHLVKRDFVLEWYETISEHAELKHFSDKILESLFQQLIQRISCIDLMACINESVKDIVLYLEMYNEVQCLGLNQSESNQLLLQMMNNRFQDLVLCNTSDKFDMRSSLAENVRTCLKSLLDFHHYNFSVGRELLVEVLLKNVFIPLMMLISDPEVLFPLLINILVDREAYDYCKILNLIDNEDVVIDSGIDLDDCLGDEGIRRPMASQRLRNVSLSWFMFFYDEAVSKSVTVISLLFKGVYLSSSLSVELEKDSSGGSSSDPHSR